jgi:hypothetical protein
MTEHGDTGQIGSEGSGPEHGDTGQIGSEGSGRVPYTEPVLRELGALRELTFKSGEKATAVEKAHPDKPLSGG